jgi:hypothetical protein
MEGRPQAVFVHDHDAVQPGRLVGSRQTRSIRGS